MSVFTKLLSVFLKAKQQVTKALNKAKPEVEEFLKEKIVEVEIWAEAQNESELSVSAVTGAEKKEVVLTAAVSFMAEKINKLVDLKIFGFKPFTEEQEYKIFAGIISLTLGKMIDAIVDKFNKSGWK